MACSCAAHPSFLAFLTIEKLPSTLANRSFLHAYHKLYKASILAIRSLMSIP